MFAGRTQPAAHAACRPACRNAAQTRVFPQERP